MVGRVGTAKWSQRTTRSYSLYKLKTHHLKRSNENLILTNIEDSLLSQDLIDLILNSPNSSVKPSSLLEKKTQILFLTGSFSYKRRLLLSYNFNSIHQIQKKIIFFLLSQKIKIKNLLFSVLLIIVNKPSSLETKKKKKKKRSARTTTIWVISIYNFLQSYHGLIHQQACPTVRGCSWPGVYQAQHPFDLFEGGRDEFFFFKKMQGKNRYRMN